MSKIFKFIKNNFLSIVIFICLVGFLALAEDVFNKEIMNGDIIGYNIISMFISSKLTSLVEIITWFGSPLCFILITIVYLIIKKFNKKAFIIPLNLILVTMINQLLKLILHRPRPMDAPIVVEHGYSFPSGHSMVSLAFYGYFIYLIYKNIKNKTLKYFLIILLSMLILLIGLSRIYLGVHYTSDVLSGFMLSLSYLIVFIQFTNKFIYKERI